MKIQILPALLLALAATGSVRAAQPNQAEAGAAIYNDNCAKCHGANLEGGKKAPALAEIGKKKHWTDEHLTYRIQNGAGSKMPAFRDSLSVEQIQQLIADLRAENRPSAPQQ